MALDKLIEICSPPSAPIDPLNERRIEEIRSRYGVILPRDYLKFATIHGTGCFVGEDTHLISINNPCSRYYFDNVHRETIILNTFFERAITANWLTNHHIDLDCLFPLGNDSDDVYLAWVMMPNPELWKVMLIYYTRD